MKYSAMILVCATGATFVIAPQKDATTHPFTAEEAANAAHLVDRIVELRHISPAEALRVLDSLGYAEDLRVAESSRGRSLILRGREQNVEHCEKFLQRIDLQEIRDQLNHLNVERASLAESGNGPANSPRFRALDKQIRSLADQLERESDYIALGRFLHEAEIAQATIGRIELRYEQAERDAAKAALELRELRSGMPDLNASAAITKTKKLRKHVRDAFSLRMQLQSARLFDAELKLRATRRRLGSRQQIADHIIDRRLRELESGQDTSWLVDKSRNTD